MTTGIKTRQDLPDQAEVVVERQPAEDRLVRADSKRAAISIELGHEVPVTEKCSSRLAGGTRGELEKRGASRLERVDVARRAGRAQLAVRDELLALERHVLSHQRNEAFVHDDRPTRGGLDDGRQGPEIVLETGQTNGWVDGHRHHARQLDPAESLDEFEARRQNHQHAIPRTHAATLQLARHGEGTLLQLAERQASLVLVAVSQEGDVGTVAAVDGASLDKRTERSDVAVRETVVEPLARTADEVGGRRSQGHNGDSIPAIAANCSRVSPVVRSTCRRLSSQTRRCWPRPPASSAVGATSHLLGYAPC